MKRNKKKGFTLVELLVVIAILAILASVSVVGYIGFTEKAKKSVDEQLCTQYNNLIKAENAGHENEPLTLGQLVILIEENGINANKFMTSSKAYTFAYNEGKKEVVLVEDGKVTYPSGKNYAATDLWATYTGKFVSGIYNYTLFNAEKYTELQTDGTGSQTLPDKIGIDLNNFSMDFTIDPKREVTVKNGTIVKKGAFDNVKEGENVQVIDNTTDDGSWGKIDVDPTAIKDATVGQATVVAGSPDAALPVKHTVMENKYYSSVPKKDSNGKVSAQQINLTTDFIQKTAKGGKDNEVNAIVFDGCTFVDLRLEGTAENADYVFKNCKFLNTQSYVAGFSNYNSLTIENCYIKGSNRGLNITLTGETILRNNTFDIIKKETSNHNEIKANGAQLVFNATSFDGDNIKSGVSFTAEGNHILHGLALITLHSSAVKNTENQKNNLLTAVKGGELLKFNNNKIESGVIKFTLDPGLEGDFKTWEGYKDGDTGHDEKREVARTYFQELGAAIESLIK